MNAKIYNGNVQPNPKEYKIWVNDEGIIKTWNSTEWIEQSGGSGESGGDVSSIEYLDVSGLNEEGRANMAYFASKVKLIYSHNALGGEIKAIGRPLAILGVLGMGFGPLNGSIAIEINRNDIIAIKGAINADGNPFESMGEELDAIPRLTKEEFYNLEV